MLFTTVLKKLIVRSIVLIMLGMAWQGFSVAAPNNEPEITGQALGEVFKAPVAVLASQARLIVYRPQGATADTGLVRVYINGSYHTSLMPTSYSLLCLAPGPVKVDVRQVRRNTGKSDQAGANTEIQLDGGKTVYLSVKNLEGARYGLESVDSAMATEELKTTREQIHALSRVVAAQECKDPAVDPAAKAKTPPSPAAAPSADRTQ